MGVRGLYTLMNEVPGGFKDVNILDELESYQWLNRKAPVILINLWTMANHFKQDIDDVLVGFRLNKIEQKFEKFLMKLADAGAEMIFTFQKTQVEGTDFVSLQENEYQTALELLNMLIMNSDFDRLKMQFQMRSHYEFPYNHSVMIVLCQVAERYGKLHGLDSIHSLPSTSQVKLANDNDVVAIMGLNTDYIFYSGSWAFWSDADLNMETMTIRQFNKEKILAYLNVPIEKAMLFCTLAGSLESSKEHIDQMLKFFRPWTKQLFPNVAQFVNKQRFPLTDNALVAIITEIMGRCSPELFKDFKQSLLLKDLKTCTEVPKKIDPELMKHIQGDYANFAEEILVNSPIFVSPVYLNLSSIQYLVIPFIQRTAGILLKHQPAHLPPIIFMKKYSHEEFAKTMIEIITPECKFKSFQQGFGVGVSMEFSKSMRKWSFKVEGSIEVPSVLTIVSGEISYEEKLRNLIWISGLEQFVSVDDLKPSCPDEFIVDVIICAHLAKNKLMTVSEALALMTSIVETKQVNAEIVDLPQRVSKRAFCLGILYQKMFLMVHSCVAAVGLKIFQTTLKFDGAHFQQAFAKTYVLEETISMKDLFNQLIKICSNSRRLMYDESGGSLLDASMTFEAEQYKKLRVEIDQLFEENNFQECLKKLNQALTSGSCVHFLYLKAGCLIILRNYKEANDIIRQVLKRNQRDPKALYLLGLKEYYEAQFRESISSFNAALEIFPQFENAKKQREMAEKLLNFTKTGIALMRAEKNKEAIETFTLALKADQSNEIYVSSIFFYRGFAYGLISNSDKAFVDLSKALRINETFSEALYRRAIIHFNKREYAECIVDCQAANTHSEARKLLDVAEKLLKTTPERSCYEILGIENSASSGEITKAFHKLAFKIHPDKAPANATALEKSKRSLKFHEAMKAHYTAMSNAINNSNQS